jgi:hypothetical protein
MQCSVSDNGNSLDNQLTTDSVLTKSQSSAVTLINEVGTNHAIWAYHLGFDVTF